MSLENDFDTLIGEMEDNLQAMGVLDAEFDPTTGLRGLTARILDIEPSIGGLDLDTAVNITASESTIIVGQSVVLTSKLTASYDDDTIVDVDLTGVLTGATIHFKEGNTVIGTGITDNSGVATATISNLTLGTHTIKAVFEGTENFNDCQSSNITITVNNPAPASITVSSDKPIMMKGETATISAKVLDANGNPCVGETVSFEVVNGESLGSDVTDSSGEASVYYLGIGAGDLNIKANCGIIVSEIYGIRDAKYYADYDKIKSTWTVDSSVSGRTIYNYLNNITDGTVLFKLNNLPNNFLIGLGKYYSGAQIKSMFFRNNGTNQHWYSTNSRENITRTVSQSITSNSVLKFVVSNSHTISAYVDDVLVATDTTRSSFNPTLRIDDFTATPLDLEYVIVL